MVKNHARRSCALPGMNLSMRGRRRRSFICFSPDALEGLLDPRNFFSRRTAADEGLDMSRSPILVSFTIWPSATIPTKASTVSWARCNSGKIAAMCSSRNNRLHMTMSAASTASRAAVRAHSFSAHSAAAWTVTDSPGNSFARRASTRAQGPAAWASSVTMATR